MLLTCSPGVGLIMTDPLISFMLVRGIPHRLVLAWLPCIRPLIAALHVVWLILPLSLTLIAPSMTRLSSAELSRGWTSGRLSSICWIGAVIACMPG